MAYKDFISEKELLREGGSFGAISRIYETQDFTFKKIHEILDSIIDGTISKSNPQIKTDGQNLMISFKNGEFILSRTKKHLRDFGAMALKSPDELVEYMSKIPDEVKESFRQAAVTMIECLKKVDDVVLNQIFKDGENWLSFEIINPAIKNVIDYLNKSLYLHTILNVSESGKLIGDDRKLVKVLYEQIEKIGAEHQKAFTIKPLMNAVFEKNPKEESDKKYLTEYLNKVYAEYDLKETDRVKTYIENWWRRYINDNSSTTFVDDEIEVLVDRFVNNKVDVRLVDFQKYYGSEIVKWIKSVDEKSKQLNYLLFDPIRYIHDEISYRSLSRLKTHMSPDPKKTEEIFRKDFHEKIMWIKSLPKDDPKYIKFDEDFRRLNKHRSVTDLTICEEGFTFFVDGVLYKATGYFSFINQLFGVGRYFN